jgi:hypothetical protein
MTTSNFMEFLRVLDVSIDVQDRNILLFVDNHAAQLEHVTSIEHTICVLFTELQFLHIGKQ